MELAFELDFPPALIARQLLQDLLCLSKQVCHYTLLELIWIISACLSYAHQNFIPCDGTLAMAD